MLFVFDKPDTYGFWMKDMHFSIDMIWLDENFRVVTVASDVPANSYPKTYHPTDKSLYVLETNAGYAEKNNIKVGDILDFVKEAVHNS